MRAVRNVLDSNNIQEITVAVFKIRMNSIIMKNNLVLYRIKSLREDEITKIFGKRELSVIKLNDDIYIITHLFKSKDFNMFKRFYPLEYADKNLLFKLCKGYKQEIARVIRAFLERLLLEALSQIREPGLKLRDGYLLITYNSIQIRAKLSIRWLREAEDFTYALELSIERGGLKEKEYHNLYTRIYDEIQSEFFKVLNRYGVEIKPLSILTFEEATQFKINSIEYVFGLNKRGKSPLALLSYGPYGIRSHTIYVKVFYNTARIKNIFIKAITRNIPKISKGYCIAKYNKEKDNLIIKWRKLPLSIKFEFITITNYTSKALKEHIKNFSKEYVVLLLTEKKLGDEVFGEIKFLSLHDIPERRGRLSRLQVLLRVYSLHSKPVLGSLLSAIIFKDGSIPWFISVGEEINRELERAVIIGIAYARRERGYIRIIVVMMRGDGTLICLFPKDFKVGKSMEFNEKEIREFVEDLHNYLKKLNFQFERVVIFRTRVYRIYEIESLLRNLEKAFLSKLARFRGKRINILLVSISKSVRIPNILSKRLGSYIVKLKDNVFLYYYKEWLHPLYVKFFSNFNINIGEVLIIIEILRRYNFMSMSKRCKYPAPLSYAKKIVKWIRP